MRFFLIISYIYPNYFHYANHHSLSFLLFTEVGEYKMNTFG